MNYKDFLIIFLAEYLGWVLGVSAVLIFFRKWRRLLEASLAALLARFGITELIRFFYDRPRPFEVENIIPLISHEVGHSFPSGHAAFFFALSTTIFIYHRRWGILFFLGALFMGVARVAAGLHWPSDILGGAIVGILTSLLVNLIFKNSRPQP